MHKILLVLTILFISSVTGSAQRLQLGFRVECNGVQYSDIAHSNGFSRFIPSELQIHAAIFPIEKLALEARAGIDINTRFYMGKEYGFFARYYFIKDVYGTAGLMVQHILWDSHMSWERYDKTLRMPGIGVGCNPFGAVYIELVYLYTGTQEIGYDKGTNPFTYKEYQKPIKIYYVLKLGFGFSFDLINYWQREQESNLPPAVLSDGYWF